MTIGVGILTSSGVVIAADGEETTGFIKTHQSKVASVSVLTQGVAGGCALVGGGAAGYIDAFSDELLGVFAQSKETDVLPEIKAQLHAFYKKHVIPFSKLPPHERPDFQMLIAYSRNGNSALFVTDKTTLRPCRHFGVVGVGDSFALNLLNEMWSPAFDQYAEVLAIDVLMRTKNAVEGCGKTTEVVRVSKDGVADMRAGAVEGIEQWLRLYMSFERRIRHYAIGPSSKKKELMATIKELEPFRKLLPIYLKQAFAESDLAGAKRMNITGAFTRVRGPKRESLP